MRQYASALEPNALHRYVRLEQCRPCLYRIHSALHECPPPVLLLLPLCGLGLGGGEVADRLADVRPANVQKQISAFQSTLLNALIHVRDKMADIRDKLKEQVDAEGESCIESYKVGEQVLLNAENLPIYIVSAILQRSCFLAS